MNKYHGFDDNNNHQGNYKLIYSCEEGKDNFNGFYVSKEKQQEILNADILIACYNYEEYSGDAFVLFRKENKLYEVSSSHCSCNGLEDWSPKLTTKEALLKRLHNHKDCNYGVCKVYYKQLKEVVESL